MPVIKIKSPDGKVIKITAPEGATQEQIQQVANDYITSQQKSMAPPVTQPPPAEQSVGAPSPPPAAGGAPMPQPPADGATPPKSIADLPTVSGMGSPTRNPLSYGVEEGLSTVGRGARQLFNQLSGDEEEFNKLQEEEAGKRKQWEQNRPDDIYGVGGGIGRAIGQSLPTAAGGVASAGAGLLGRILGGAAGGAAGGAVQPLTTGEQEAGYGAANIGLGAALGGAAAPAMAGVGAATNKLRDVVGTPIEAMKDFIGKQLGASNIEGATAANQSLLNKLRGAASQAKDKYRTLYTEGEESLGLPPVQMTETANALKKMSGKMSNRVLKALDPKTANTVSGLRKATTKQKTLPSGETTRVPDQTTLVEVRDSIRSLRAKEREFRRVGKIDQADQIKEAEQAMRGDLDEWAANDPSLADRLRKLDEIDVGYKNEVLPLTDKKKSIGKMIAAGDEKAIKRELFQRDSGMALNDLMGRVPGAKDDLRAMLGHSMLTGSGPTVRARKLSGGTTNEALLSKQEREWLDQLSGVIAENAPIHSGLPLGRAELIRALLTGTPKVKKYGMEESIRRKMLDALRGAGVGGAGAGELTRISEED